MKKYLTLMCMAVAISGCNSEPPVSVELGRNPYWGGPQLHITAKQDTVTINDIKINRGNCKANIHEHLPYKIPFGEVLKADAPSCQKVVEVSISTSEGDYDFSFDS
ncbi:MULTISPECIES: hypothetical protein [unclassified Pseudomonas]|uniref:hypothetical protein n=1 Tax=unclassified Pseudomonas TaxID=196821 RepID=UPI0002A2E663|nr:MULTISPECIES: hypothetical protein [unclassified Pseudomonas]MBB1606105.1 hypothetical protein [Pseudomonas sp. UMC76]MBB1636578.1 hypothetical protein [Pseudomonas sp. UME83]NTX92255.1 hypothetical protein [Pseudomonas sp. UMA643]NTY19963.1 hypothetical protein [Pseudomonas sp. UMC3103]NTY27665.1 hypothetical protein [Pseudomonas sp. UMA603]